MKMFALPLVAVLAISSALLVPQSQAQGQAFPKPGPDYSSLRLSSSDVDMFIKAFPDMVKQFNDLNFSPVGPNVGGMVDSLKAKERLEAFAKSKGYQDGALFASHCGSILLSYYVLKIDEARKQMAGEAAGLPPESKTMLDAQFKKLDEQVAAQRKMLSLETVEAVKARLPELDKIVQNCNAQR